jgi:hypothetical protein
MAVCVSLSFSLSLSLSIYLPFAVCFVFCGSSVTLRVIVRSVRESRQSAYLRGDVQCGPQIRAADRHGTQSLASSAMPLARVTMHQIVSVVQPEGHKNELSLQAQTTPLPPEATNPEVPVM